MKSGYSHCSMTQAKVFKSTRKCPRALTFENMRQGWDDIVRAPDFKNRYRTGGLGIRLVPGQWHVWVCDRYDTCHGGKVEDDMMCYAFNEEKSFFLPLGPNSKVKFVKSKKMSAPPAGGTLPLGINASVNYTGSMNGSVGGMNGSEGSGSINGSSCENVAGWVDSQNRTCEAYEEDKWLCVTGLDLSDLSWSPADLYPRGNVWAASNVSAVEACCTCGGGWAVDSGRFNYTAVQEMVPDQDRVLLSWRHSQDLDLWVCDKSDLIECVGYTRTTASFAGGTITLDVDITEGPGVETTEFRSVNSGTIEVWVEHYSQAFTSIQVLNYPATVYVYCYVCLDDDNQQKAGYVRSVTQDSDDVPDAPSTVVILTCGGSNCSSGCTPSLGATSGTISDGTGDYANSASCWWLLATSPGVEIRIAFPSFDTEAGYDFVSIYECGSASCLDGKVLKHLSGARVDASNVYTSMTGFLKVTFTSDGSVTGSGFTGTWSVGGKKWWKVGEFTWPSGSVRTKWTTCVTGCYSSCGVSMNCSVGGMNGSEGSDSVSGTSCENMAGWADSQNRTCEAYEEDKWLCVTAVFDADAENISAVEACCSCGGGWAVDSGGFNYTANASVNYTGSSVGGMNGSEGSDGMSGSSCENVEGWMDSQNRTCEAYEEDGWLCETAVLDADAENISAVEACCSCGGGWAVDSGGFNYTANASVNYMGHADAHYH